MIQETFSFLPGISKRKEAFLKTGGIKNWNSFLKEERINGISTSKKREYNQILACARTALIRDELEFFTQFKKLEVWRLFDLLRERAVYLETTGYGNDITVIGLYDGFTTKFFVKHFNLERKAVENELKKYRMVITFNGSSFDIPLLKRYLGKFSIPFHLDVRHLCKKANVEGTLKEIERYLGIKRDEEVRWMKGSDAIMLWSLWILTKKEEYLKTLVKYNREDVVNLEPIAVKIIGILNQEKFTEGR